MTLLVTTNSPPPPLSSSHVLPSSHLLRSLNSPSKPFLGFFFCSLNFSLSLFFKLQIFPPPTCSYSLILNIFIPFHSPVSLIMSSMMCQGLQSCLETQTFEAGAPGLHLAPNKGHFSPPLIHVHVKSHVSDSDSDSDSDNEEREKSAYTDNSNCYNNNNNKTIILNTHLNGDLGGWNFLETSLAKEAKVEEKEPVYVHPLALRTLSSLSKKSLELCTENLGCETGSDIGENIDMSYSSSSDSENGMSPTRERSKLSQYSHKKVNQRSFPPPLTSISSADGLHFRPHREGGRLVIKAVTIVPSQACFQAERGDGRLRLRFTQDYDSPNVENDDKIDEDEDQEEDEDEFKEEDAQEDSEGYSDEEVEDNNSNIEGEMVNGSYRRHFRCTEHRQGKNGLLLWEPLLSVATS